jgi:hypothetical protein
MTKQQLKDYEKVQPTILLAMWVNDGNPDSVPESELLKLPLEYAISDIDSMVDNARAELGGYEPETEYEWEIYKRMKAGERFLRKYNR